MYRRRRSRHVPRSRNNFPALPAFEYQQPVVRHMRADARATKEQTNEAYQDPEHQTPAEHAEKRRMRGMPDFLSVSLQDILHGWQSDL